MTSQPQTATHQSSKQAATQKQPANLTNPIGSAVLPLELQQALTNPQLARPEAVLQLQRRYGNQAVNRLLGPARSLANQSADLPAEAISQSAGSESVIQRKVRNAIVTIGTRARIMGDKQSLIHGTAGPELEVGKVLKVHDNKTFKSRLQTDRRQAGYRQNNPDTVWHKLADPAGAYIRIGTFRLLKDVETGSESESEDDEVRPFRPEEMVYISNNPNLCEGMVTTWMQNKGQLQKYFNMQASGVLGITHTEASPFHAAASNVPKQKDSTKQSEYINHLHQLHPTSAAPSDAARYAPMSQLLAKIQGLPNGAMLHVSMRKDPIHSGGHAIGVARFGTAFYIFDPNSGTAKLSPARLEEAVAILLNQTTDMGQGVFPGEWSEYGLFYAVMVPDSGFTGLAPQRMPEDPGDSD